MCTVLVSIDILHVSVYLIYPATLPEAQMALTGTSASRLQGKLRDLDARLANAEKRQMVAGPKGSKGDKGYSGLQVRIAQLTYYSW